MRLVSYFDPSLSTGGRIDTEIADAGAKLLLRNASPYNMQLSFQDGSTPMIGAWEINYWTIDGYTPSIDWVMLPSLDVAPPPISQCFVIVYEPGERIEGTYPSQMAHQTSIGNSQGVNTNLTTTDNVKNMSNPFLTPIVTGQPNSAVFPFTAIYNDGTMQMTPISNGASTPVLSITQGAYNTPAQVSLQDVVSIGLQPGARLYITDSNGNHIASIDANGNMRLKGVLTQNTTP